MLTVAVLALVHLARLVASGLSGTDPTPLIHANLVVVTAVLGSVVPLVVALVAAHGTSGEKAWTNVIASAVGGVGAYFLAHNGTASVLQIVTVVISTFTISGVTYSHFWKPTGIAAKVRALRS